MQGNTPDFTAEQFMVQFSAITLRHPSTEGLEPVVMAIVEHKK